MSQRLLSLTAVGVLASALLVVAPIADASAAGHYVGQPGQKKVCTTTSSPGVSIPGQAALPSVTTCVKKDCGWKKVGMRKKWQCVIGAYRRA